MRIFRIMSTGGVVAILTDGVAADWIKNHIPREWGGGQFWTDSAEVEDDLSIYKALNRPLDEILKGGEK